MRHHENDLLRYVDGELPFRATARVRSHLEACWQCREEREQLETIVAECVRYRKDLLQRYLPSPPAPWADIYQGFAGIDASMEPGIFHRLRHIVEWPAQDVRRWAVAAIALLVLWGVFYRFRQTPRVEAAELLQKAVAAADSSPVKVRRIQIRTRQQSITRLVGPHVAINAADHQTASSLQGLFLAAHFDWDDPLSAKAFQSWRNQLSDKHDDVVPEHERYLVRTGTHTGTLASATLTLRARDLGPVEERLEFRNQDWVEITALNDEPAPVPGGIVAPVEHRAAAPALEPAAPSAAPPTIPPAAATVGDELHVLAALHQLGADLGDPIEVSLTGGKVLVSGIGIPAQRQQEITQALASTPRVVVQFSDAATPIAQPQREAPVQAPITADVRALQARIAQQMGGRVYFDQLAAQVLDMNESMMSRAYALHRLAERFPASTEAELASDDVQLLRKLQQEHTAALRQQVFDIDRVLRPVLVSVSGRTRPDTSVTSSKAWQPATEDLFQSARNVEKLLAGMFGAAPLETSEDQLPSQLLTAFAQLRTRLDIYNGLVTQPLERRDR